MSASPRLLSANRSQVILATVDVERLIADDHPARAVWEFVGRLDLEPYQLAIKSVEGADYKEKIRASPGREGRVRGTNTAGLGQPNVARALA